MKILLAALAGYAVLFYLLYREDFEIGETLGGFEVLAMMVSLGIPLVNWLFGTDFSGDAWVVVWLGCFAVWTVAAIWYLIGEYRERCTLDKLWQSIRDSEPS
jgi:hypothetical protein